MPGLLTLWEMRHWGVTMICLFKWIQQPKLGIIDWLLYPRDIVVDDWYTMYINNSSKNQIIDILEIIHQSGWLRWFISL
jgi:hypothetical protein